MAMFASAHCLGDEQGGGMYVRDNAVVHMEVCHILSNTAVSAAVQTSESLGAGTVMGKAEL